MILFFQPFIYYVSYHKSNDYVIHYFFLPTNFFFVSFFLMCTNHILQVRKKKRLVYSVQLEAIILFHVKNLLCGLNFTLQY